MVRILPVAVPKLVIPSVELVISSVAVLAFDNINEPAPVTLKGEAPVPQVSLPVTVQVLPVFTGKSVMRVTCEPLLTV